MECMMNGRPRRLIAIAAGALAAIFVLGFVVGQVAGIGRSAAHPSPNPSRNTAHSRLGWPGFHVWGLAPKLGGHASGARPVLGTVTAVSGSTITIKPLASRFGPSAAVTTIDVTAKTVYRTGPNTTGSLSSIKTGQKIIAVGSLDSSGKVLTAGSVALFGTGWLPRLRSRGPFAVPPDVNAFKQHAGGTVTAINGSSITVKPNGYAFAFLNNGDKPVTIRTSSKTVVRAPGTQTGSLSSIKVGDNIFAGGTLTKDGKTLTASTIIVLTNLLRAVNPPHTLHGPIHGAWFGTNASGIVTAVHGNRVTIKDDAAMQGRCAADQAQCSNMALSPIGVTTVVISSRTTVQSGWGVNASASTIKTGDHIVATGTLSKDGKSLAASTVLVVPVKDLQPLPMLMGRHSGKGA
jgi:hypothetical protein